MRNSHPESIQLVATDQAKVLRASGSQDFEMAPSTLRLWPDHDLRPGDVISQSIRANAVPSRR